MAGKIMATNEIMNDSIEIDKDKLLINLLGTNLRLQAELSVLRDLFLMHMKMNHNVTYESVSQIYSDNSKAAFQSLLVDHPLISDELMKKILDDLKKS